MSVVTVRRRVAASVDQTWERVTDLDAHARHVPLTSAHVDGPAGLGQAIVMRTALGPLGFDDPMTVTGWDLPPAPEPRMRLVKRGRVLDGWAEIRLRPLAGGTEVVWAEEIRPASPLRALARPAGRLTGRATTAMIERILAGLLADLPVVEPAR